jgi:methionyl aminopeptidase
MPIRIKTPEEIEGIKRSCKVAAQVVDFAGRSIKPGMTTGELNAIIAEEIRRFGAKSATLNYAHPRGKTPYPAESCISLNEVVCHGVPGKRVVRTGDIVKVDVTTIVDGFYGDTCRTFPVGKVGSRTAELLEVTQKCLEIGIGQVRPGNKIGNIGYFISQYAKLMGYSVVYEYCGHGVGLEFHEEPQVPHIAHKDTGPVMCPGMTFTIEPMINSGRSSIVVSEEDHWTVFTKDKRFSAQFEHTVLVTDSGCEILTTP